MKGRSVVRRFVAFLLSAMLVFSLLPTMAMKTAEAAVSEPEYEKTVVSLGTSAMKAPTGDSTIRCWTGSFVWFGHYDGEPVRYRVLAPKTTIFGGTTMFLDCDNVLFSSKMTSLSFDDNNIWGSSMLRTSLNGDGFLTKAGVFTEIERNAVATSTKASHALTVGTKAGQVASWTQQTFQNYCGLSGDKIFLLDSEDVSNSA